MDASTKFNVGSVASYGGHTLTKQSDSTFVAEGVPFTDELWADEFGNLWTPTEQTLLGNAFEFVRVNITP